MNEYVTIDGSGYSDGYVLLNGIPYQIGSLQVFGDGNGLKINIIGATDQPPLYSMRLFSKYKDSTGTAYVSYTALLADIKQYFFKA